MMHRIFSLLWKLAIIVSELIGLSMAVHLPTGPFRWVALHYFTNLSNLLALVYFAVATAVLLCRPDHRPTVWPVPKGAVTMMLLLTMLVAQFMLGGSHTTVLILLHIVCPLLVLLDWLFFDEKGLTRKFFPLLWSVLPILYLCYVMVAARIGDGIGEHSRYPYPFLDVDAQGGGVVAITVVVMLVAYILVGYLLCLIDHAFAQLGGRRKLTVS